MINEVSIMIRSSFERKNQKFVLAFQIAGCTNLKRNLTHTHDVVHGILKLAACLNNRNQQINK